MRFVEAGEADGETDGTRLFSALGAALADVPPDRVAGAIMITDGRVHDVPAEVAALGFNAPVHALITGARNERDRRVVLVDDAALRHRRPVADHRLSRRGPGRAADAGARSRSAATARCWRRRTVTRRQHRAARRSRSRTPGRTSSRSKPRRSTANSPPVNNRAVVSIDGVRDKLRVLLVSGEPHAGERTWRNLLKSDACVDLVHFTILRPPEKQDGTPINELSLIAFPTRELFQQKINEFHLIIFDRYARQGVLPIIYFDNIARYVQRGRRGAGRGRARTTRARPASGARRSTPILPAEPSGQHHRDAVSRRSSPTLGKRHPVTRGLEGADSESAALEPLVPPGRYRAPPTAPR